jgi:hypothetical protein
MFAFRSTPAGSNMPAMIFGGTLKSFLPQRLVARIDFHRYPGRLECWGGAFNGQCGRQQTVMDLFHAFPFTHVVETGTFYGMTTEFLARETRLPVFTVEASRAAYQLARLRLRPYPNVKLFFGDSRSFLREVVRSAVSANSLPFVYLDAHWGTDLPLLEEVRIVLASYPQCIVMIDDFQVPHDQGYAFDDYGPGKALKMEYLSAVVEEFLAVVAYPVLPSVRESGARRGCVVLAPSTLGDDLGKVLTLTVDISSNVPRVVG